MVVGLIIHYFPAPLLKTTIGLLIGTTGTSRVLGVMMLMTFGGGILTTGSTGTLTTRTGITGPCTCTMGLRKFTCRAPARLGGSTPRPALRTGWTCSPLQILLRGGRTSVQLLTWLYAPHVHTFTPSGWETRSPNWTTYPPMLHVPVIYYKIQLVFCLVRSALNISASPRKIGRCIYH